MICEVCGYEWEPRVEKPKQCPRCKRYIKHDTITTKHCQKEEN